MMNTLQTRFNSGLDNQNSARGIDGMLQLSDSGQFLLSVPPVLKDHQNELEMLLSKVFRGKVNSPDSLALARQMSINWCVLKCKQTGQSVEQCMEFLS
jgi:hypothetical protein